MAVCLLVPLFIERFTIWEKLSWQYALAGILFLMLVFVIGVEKYGAKNWISLGGIDIQPSEFVKIIYVFFIAGALSKFRDFKHIVVISAIAAVHVLILVAEKDLGAALIYFIHLSCYAVFGYDAGGISGGRIGSRGGGCGGCLQTFLACADPCDCLERAMAAY